MTIYAIYDRDSGGIVRRVRTCNEFPFPGQEAEYCHPGTLAGWPEYEITWNSPFGEGTGVAKVQS